jgi:DNA-directed RNA polymerase specialized sigma24 family protein
MSFHDDSTPSEQPSPDVVPPAEPKPIVLDAEELRRRRRLLGDPEIIDAIRAVVRLRGVEEQDVDDEVNTVVARAMGGVKLPIEKEEVRLYVCGIARYRSVDVSREQSDQPESLDDYTNGAAYEPASPAASPEAQTDRGRLISEADRKLPRFSWLVRSEVEGETSEEIARTEKVSPSRVREEVLGMKLALARKYVAGVLAIIGALWLFVAGMSSWMKPERHHDYTAGQPSPAELRERARKDCDAGRWQTCLDELRAANVDDPSGETPALRELRVTAQQHVATLDAGAAPQN